ncbi:MAG: methyltransferase domain-containing protein [Nitrospiraceae bacterium]|nr:methyltransferase domain-containing protein [Nitrospiraceae bacterium]
MKEKCPVCNSMREVKFTAQILKKYNVNYLYCRKCGLLQTEKPYWLDEAYSNAISNADTGLLTRNINISKKLSALLYFCFDRDGRYLDVAGGYGILTRLMRDIGFDFYWADQYCQNLFAQKFTIAEAEKSFSAITAVEVFEHLNDPIQFIRKCLSQMSTKTIIFSTVLFEGEPPAPNDWWYYSFATGQHVSFYQRRTLFAIAEKLNLRLYSNRYMHIFTDQNISNSKYHLLMSPISKVLSWYVSLRLDSLTMSDHIKIINE